MQLVAEMKLSKVEDDLKQAVLVGILLGLSVCAGSSSSGASKYQGSNVCDSNKKSCPDACSSSPCLNGGTCTAIEPDRFTCACVSGKIGPNCEYEDPCIEEPCVNGKCVAMDLNGSYRCDCTGTEFVGPFCTIRNPCKLDNPCLNEGTCHVDMITGGITCECTGHFVGTACEFEDKCAKKPCHNGGLCTLDTNENVVCICDTGYTGEHCDNKVMCDDTVCKNGGICKSEQDQDGNIKFKSCTCKQGFVGEYCEIRVTCADNPCEHGGKCTQLQVGDSYKCSCEAGYSGMNCEIIEFSCGQDITTKYTQAQVSDTCETSNPCEHSGLCRTNLDEEKICICDAGFTGKHCQTPVTNCDDVCKNGGTCTEEGVGKFKCICTRQYVGPRCEIEVGKETLYAPVKKSFCPVVQTILERDGCKKCYADAENCEGCCQKNYLKCADNCKRLETFCESCTSATNIHDECKSANCGGEPWMACMKLCDEPEVQTCKSNCNETPPGNPDKPANCPKIYSCPKTIKVSINTNGEVTGEQCRAFKHPSGVVECAYKAVTAKKTEYQSYIMFPRIHFAGKVQIDSATLNNVFSNFDINTFATVDYKKTNENWNPYGSSEFRLVDVSVTRVCYEDGSCSYRPHADPVADAPVKDQANGKVPAKIVDLDVEIQGRVSEIYGLSIDVGGFFKADMERASFQSLWYKMIDEPNDDYGEGSRFQSVLNNVQFSENHPPSKIVTHLKEHIGPNQKLSICFNIDLMGEHPATNYSFARIVGSIGLAGESAPHFFDRGRLLWHLPATRELSYAPFTVNENEKRIYIDLGNTLAIAPNGNLLNSIGQLALGVYADSQSTTDLANPNCLGDITWISRIYYHQYGGYYYTSGINVIDIPTHLIGKLNKQIVLAKVDESRSCLKIVLAEHKEGINVRANSHFIYRAQYQEVVQGSLFVTSFGKNPNPNQSIGLKLQTSDSIIRSHTRGPPQPFGLFPTSDPSIYNYYFYAMTNPNNPRKYIDGQIYALQYTFNGYPLNPDRDEAMNTAVFFHVYDVVTTSEQTTWLTHIRPIFQLYANLFPVMNSFLDLGNYHNVVEKKCHILTAMSLDFGDPQFMPVTRDLSPKKTEMVLKWLYEDEPNFGLTYHPKLRKQHLLDMLQTALQLEHTTIPIYLNGFLSIKPYQNEEVKNMLHQIIVEEMFHFAQVANIINGLGGRPYILGKTFVPAFPTHLPGGCRPNMIASIDKISAQQVHDVYMEIEEPSIVLKEHELVALINKISDANLKVVLSKNSGSNEYSAVCKDALDFFPLPKKMITETNHNTIGDLYTAVVYVLGQLSICGKKNIFTGTTTQLKWDKPEYLREVHSYEDALKAIKAIVAQGEGASPYNPLQQNVDSSELSHYFKFSSIFHGREITTFNVNVTHEKVYKTNEKQCHENYVYAGDKISFFQTGVWPVVKNPQMSKYKPDSQAYKNAQAFNNMYRRLLDTLQSVFDGNVDRFDDTFGLMKSLMVYGNRVVQTPIDEDGDPNVGPNAGPTYFN